LNTLAIAVNEDPGTIEEVYEPFLIQQGFIQRTPRGREATALAYKRFGKNKFNSEDQSLFE
ncbi:MAG: Holliday junction branch migration DNA helicase RuvB, partial [Ignavibacteria bacterium]|nr:Holliday junction branch migration DNA helicase RuvB [Ignavibacteria bacterium]